MFGERTIVFFEKAIIFLAAFAIVAYATIALMQWSDPFKDFFLKTGRWEEFAIIMAFVLGIGYVLRYLLKLVFRVETNINPHKQRKRWR